MTPSLFALWAILWTLVLELILLHGILRGVRRDIQELTDLIAATHGLVRKTEGKKNDTPS